MPVEASETLGVDRPRGASETRIAWTAELSGGARYCAGDVRGKRRSRVLECKALKKFVDLLDEYVVRDNREDTLIDVPDVEMGREALVAFMRHYWGTFKDSRLTHGT